MSWPDTLVFVRHAESEGNVRNANERTTYEMGTWEYPLTERGRRQAELTGKYLDERFGKFDVHYTSYYKRSKETMEIMYPGAKVYEDPRLAEAQRGLWHIMTEEQMLERFPEEVTRKKREGLYHYRPRTGLMSRCECIRFSVL